MTRSVGRESTPYVLDVNGRARTVEGGWVGESLAFVLRERLGLPATKTGCEQGECGSCSVLVDGVLVCACLVLARGVGDRPVVSPEGLNPEARGDLTPVQRAFVDAGAIQCGFCTPGLIVTVHDLLERVPDPDELEIREALAGNLCRCTGYGRIVAAVHAAAATRRAS